MPRPCKRRRVCGRPVCARFGPRGQERTPEEPFVSMTLDEYECIRLMDLEGLTRIVVTHSLDEALLRRYDGILVLKDGSLAECGRFDELMERKGYFYSLYTVSQ